MTTCSSTARPGGSRHCSRRRQTPRRPGAQSCVIHIRNRAARCKTRLRILARSFVQCGMRALRFNFRGVGSSDGEFDEARGEVGDALAAIAYLRSRWPDDPVWVSGFSFGAAVAIRTAVQAAAAGLVSVAPAVSRFAGTLDEPPTCPWLIVHGDQDELIPVEETLEWVNSLQPGPELQVFADTGHFFHGKLVELRGAVTAFIEAKKSRA
ncbi:MAG: alpha/beta hydrolase [Woeseiaceae bacterium]|nr:alpha/beta hydrolase [Woeseiaceae bacterium]